MSLEEARTTCKSEDKATTVVPGYRKVVRSTAGENRGMSLGQILRSRLVSDTT